MKLFSVIPILTYGLLLGCAEKDNDFKSQACTQNCLVVNGTITTLSGLAGIEGLKIVARWSNTQPLGGGTIRSKASVVTDKNGHYEMKFEIRDDELLAGHFDLIFGVDKEKYLFFASDGIYINKVKKDTTIVINYLIPKKSFVDLEIINPEKMVLSSDNLMVDFFSKMGQYDMPIGATINFGKDYSSAKVEVAGGQELFIKVYKNKNQVKSTTADTITIEPGRSVNYKIEF